jgi:hypothetical protein
MRFVSKRFSFGPAFRIHIAKSIPGKVGLIQLPCFLLPNKGGSNRQYGAVSACWVSEGGTSRPGADGAKPFATQTRPNALRAGTSGAPALLHRKRGGSF